MEYGVSYPTNEVTADPAAVRKFVRAAEELGFSHIMAYDHVLVGPHDNRDPPLTGPYTEEDKFHDPFVLFGHMSGLSETLGFVTGVLVLPQRPTALVAQQAATLAHVSGDRLRLGVGIGWNYLEYEALGQNFKVRAKRLEEQVELLRRLWTEPVVDFTGKFDRVDRMGLNPLPTRPVPLWIGGYSEPAYERGARIGDGFVFAAGADDAVAAWGRVKHHLAEFGRREDEFGRELLTIFARTPQETADTLRRFRDAGGTHGTIHSLQKRLGPEIDAHIDWAAETKRLIDGG
ncbi:MAG: LLM class F420-dependent oxidoreductase [Novosphingobium sp.]|nr:LLM class F420-dependent oxidoreductase [Novosphingobium sp.]